jgi:hypothetical protein
VRALRALYFIRLQLNGRALCRNEKHYVPYRHEQPHTQPTNDPSEASLHEPPTLIETDSRCDVWRCRDALGETDVARCPNAVLMVAL